MMEEFPLVSEIMEQSLGRTVEILNAIQSGPAAEKAGTAARFAIGTAGQLGMAALIMVCAAIGTVVLLKLIKRLFWNGRDEQ